MRPPRLASLGLALGLLSLSVATPSHGASGTEPTSWARCLTQTARAIPLHPDLLHAIVEVESSGKPLAIGWREPDGSLRSLYPKSHHEALTTIKTLQRRQRSFDVGLAQINSRNLRRFEHTHGITPEQALQPCTNLKLAAAILQEKLAQHGHTWKAISAYNGSTSDDYMLKVWRRWCRRQGTCPVSTASTKTKSRQSTGHPNVTSASATATSRPPTPSTMPERPRPLSAWLSSLRRMITSRQSSPHHHPAAPPPRAPRHPSVTPPTPPREIQVTFFDPHPSQRLPTTLKLTPSSPSIRDRRK